MTLDEQKTLVELLQTHPELCNQEIADRVGCGRTTVRRWRDNLNIPQHTAGRQPDPNKPKPKPTIKAKKEIINPDMDKIIPKPKTHTVIIPKTKRRGFYASRYIDFEASEITGVVVDNGLETQTIKRGNVK